jgi:hypothetical protein
MAPKIFAGSAGESGYDLSSQQHPMARENPKTPAESSLDLLERARAGDKRR